MSADSHESLCGRQARMSLEDTVRSASYRQEVCNTLVMLVRKTRWAAKVRKTRRGSYNCVRPVEAATIA